MMSTRNYYGREKMNKKIQLAQPLKIGERGPVINFEDLYMHMCVCGGSGKGKTTFLMNLLHQISDCALIVIDPHGDLANKVYSMYPRAQYISLNSPISLNPLKRNLPSSSITNDLIDVVNLATKVASSKQMGITVLMARILRKAIKVGFKNLQELSDFLDYESTRKKYKNLTDYWTDFDKKSNKGRGGYRNNEARQSAKRITARFSLFLDDEQLKPFIIGENEFTVQDIAQNKEVYIFNLHSFDETIAKFIGSLVTAYVRSYYMREASPLQDNKPLVLLVDEVNWFMDANFERFLTESRKYNVSTVMSFHTFSDLSRSLAGLIWTSCYTKIYLGGNYIDARNFAQALNYKIPKLEKYEGIIGIEEDPMHVMFLPPPKIESVKPPVAINFLRNAWINP